ncbi:hypothetical protein SAMN04487906_0743 [Zhouia amylolytica]|uniref:Uncharacterized protein n=2 Tax=Zhouia amylolytica TaxID=376730 RepID=W2UPH6_9FLAO|nr:hypothetical protein [Zhouia amylolytica]ETN95893.1 hypothetical protein P278_16150 [Zhouia amylolytica AD3]SFS53832.1 hypothetical protein SAMN04487906_0743 [Zhouia amylolytica]
MKKLFLVALIIGGLVISCTPDSNVQETNETYGYAIDKDSIVTPGGRD